MGRTRKQPSVVLQAQLEQWEQRKREQELRARDFPRPAPAEPEPKPPPQPPVPAPSVVESPFKIEPIALPPESPSARESPIIRDSPKPPKGTGDSRVKHAFFDERLSGREVTAQLLYFHLNRYREGGGDVTIPLTWKRLTERIPVSESTLRRAYAVLKREGLALIERHVYGRNSVQGIVFRVVRGESPSTHESPFRGDSHKSNNLKANEKGALPRDFKDCPDCLGTGVERMPDGTYRPGCSHPKLRGGAV